MTLPYVRINVPSRAAEALALDDPAMWPDDLYDITARRTNFGTTFVVIVRTRAALDRLQSDAEDRADASAEGFGEEPAARAACRKVADRCAKVNRLVLAEGSPFK